MRSLSRLAFIGVTFFVFAGCERASYFEPTKQGQSLIENLKERAHNLLSSLTESEFSGEIQQKLAMEAVTSIDGTSQIIESEPEFGLPSSKIYSFRACLDPKQIPLAFTDAKAQISGTNSKSTLKILSDQCASWKEIIHFHYTAPSRHVILSRDLLIKKNGAIKSISLQFGINPWMHGESNPKEEVADFVNLIPRKAVNLKDFPGAFDGADIKDLGAPLIANDSRVNFQLLGMQSSNVGKFTFDFRIPPQIELLSSSNNPAYNKIVTGDFDVEAYLLSVSLMGQKVSRRLLNIEPYKGVAHISDGTLSFIKDITLDRISTQGRLELAIVLKPKQKTALLKTFKGIYILGDYNELKTNFYARIKPEHSNSNKNFNFDEYTGLDKYKEGAPFPDVNNLEDGMRPLKFEFEPLKFDQTAITNESSTKRTVLYQVKACIKNGIDATPLRAYRFVITKSGTEIETKILKQKTSTRTAEFDSCIYWDDQITHALYPQKYFKVTYRVKSDELNIDDNLVAYINPWSISGSRDWRTIETDETDTVINRPEHKATLKIPTYRARLMNLKYSIDHLGNLGVNKYVSFYMDPQVLNYSSLLKGREARDSLRDGPWRIRWTLVNSQSLNLSGRIHVIDSGDGIWGATQGRLAPQLVFHFKDLREIDARNFIFIELSPIDEDLVTYSAKLGQYLPKAPTATNSSLVDRDSGIRPQTFFGSLILSLAGTEETHGLLETFPHDAVTLADSEQLQMEGSLNSFNELPTDPRALWPLFAKDQRRWNITGEMQNQIFKLYEEANHIKTWDITKPSDKLAIREYLAPTKSDFANDTLDTVLKSQKMTTELQVRLCSYFFEKNPVQNFKPKTRFFSLRPSDYWLKLCLHDAQDKKVRLLNSQIEYQTSSIDNLQHTGTATSTMVVGAGYTINFSDAKANATNLSAGLQMGAPETAKFKLFKNMMNIGPAGSVSVSHSSTTSFSKGTTSSISEGFSINVRAATYNLNGTQNRICITTSINPAMYIQPHSDLYDDFQKSFSDSAQRQRFIDQKLRLCRTFESPQPFNLKTTYYIMAQDLGPSSFVDNTDIKNRPLLFTLRGRSSFESFLRIANLTMKPSTTPDQLNPAVMTFDTNSLRGVPLQIPNIPGLISEPIGY